jgi:hypothetical protein
MVFNKFINIFFSKEVDSIEKTVVLPFVYGSDEKIQEIPNRLIFV